MTANPGFHLQNWLICIVSLWRAALDAAYCVVYRYNNDTSVDYLLSWSINSLHRMVQWYYYLYQIALHIMEKRLMSVISINTRNVAGVKTGVLYVKYGDLHHLVTSYTLILIEDQGHLCRQFTSFQIKYNIKLHIFKKDNLVQTLVDYQFVACLMYNRVILYRPGQVKSSFDGHKIARLRCYHSCLTMLLNFAPQCLRALSTSPVFLSKLITRPLHRKLIPLQRAYIPWACQKNVSSICHFE